MRLTWAKRQSLDRPVGRDMMRAAQVPDKGLTGNPVRLGGGPAAVSGTL